MCCGTEKGRLATVIAVPIELDAGIAVPGICHLTSCDSFALRTHRLDGIITASLLGLWVYVVLILIVTFWEIIVAHDALFLVDTCTSTAINTSLGV